MALLFLHELIQDMKIHEGYKDLSLKKPVVTLGIFDGVHLGHRKLLESLVGRAKEIGGESVVITFHPHPRVVLEEGARDLMFLTTLDEKKILLENFGIDNLVIISFTKKFSRMKACDFVEKILVENIGTSHLVVGYDHHFGHRGEGSFNLIKECAVSMGFNVEKVTGLKTSAGAISSSLIRNALISGRLSLANKWLGYDYSLRGRVVEGRRIGRDIGFPTANIKPSDRNKLIPGNGVYAVDTYIDDIKHIGMLSIGTNPTVSKGNGKISVEVNIFDFRKDIYGSEIEVVFRHRLRSEKKFRTTMDLSEQMALDKKIALRLLASE